MSVIAGLNRNDGIIGVSPILVNISNANQGLLDLGLNGDNGERLAKRRQHFHNGIDSGGAYTALHAGNNWLACPTHIFEVSL